MSEEADVTNTRERLWDEAVLILGFLACVDLDYPKEHDELLIEDSVRDAKLFMEKLAAFNAKSAAA